MTKIQVPRGMAEAYMQAVRRDASTFAGLEAALQWLSEHPIVPTDEQIESLLYGMKGLENFGRVALKRGAVEWQRRMFLAEPEIPEEIRELMIDVEPHDPVHKIMVKHHNEDVLESFRRGQRSKG